jgi:hypothetical protein
MKTKLRVKASLKTISLATATISIVAVMAVIIGYHITQPPNVMASASGDYRSIASGNWSSAAIWEKYNGTTWAAAATAPATTDGVITIQTGTTVNIGTSVASDQVVIDAGGTLTVATGKTWTISNGTGTDIQVDGTLTINGNMVNNSCSMIINGTVTLKNGGSHTFASSTAVINSGGLYDRQDNSLTTTAGIFTINSGGTYAHDLDGQNMIIATWNTGSTCLINGITGTKPGNLNQTFSNLTWNSSNQTANLALAGKITDVTGDFTIISTGTGSIRLGDGENYVLNIGGNFNHQGGTLTFSSKSQNCKTNIGGDFLISGGTVNGNDSTKDSGQGSPEIYITGNLNISGGTLDCSQYINSGIVKGHMDVYLYGNYIQSNGTVTVNSSGGGVGEMNFNKTGLQNFTKSGGTISQEVNFTVKTNSITDFGTSVVTGGGTFDNEANSEMRIGHASGITSSGATGTVQVTGTRTFLTTAYYTYNGTTSQVTGSGLPTTVKNLTINNTSGVALTTKTSVSGTFYMTAGTLTTPSDTIIIGTSTATLGAVSRTSGVVDGVMKRWFTNATVNNIEFPLGTGGLYQGVVISYTGAPTAAGSVTSTFTATNPGKNGFNITDAGDTLVNIGYGLWQTTTGNGLSGGTFSLDITATSMSTVSDPTKLHLIRRTNSGSVWTASGTHVAGTGTTAIPIAHRTGLTSHAQWGIASGSTNPLPVTLLYFNAKKNDDKIDLTWATAAEINNDHFTVERSSDGITFTDLLTKRGSGNTTVKTVYQDADLKPFKGVNYYRLRQTDFNDVTVVSDIKSVDFGGESNPDVSLFSIYPNPFNSGFKISFTAVKESEATFILMNSSGSLVAQKKIETQRGYNTYEYLEENDLPAGIYFGSLVMGETKLTQRILKQ